MPLALRIASAWLAPIATEGFGDTFFTLLAAGDPVIAVPVRDPNVRIMNATIAIVPIDTAAIVNCARIETPESPTVIVPLREDPALRIQTDDYEIMVYYGTTTREIAV